MTGWLKLLLELGPLGVFFVVFTVLAPGEITPDLLKSSGWKPTETTMEAAFTTGEDGEVQMSPEAQKAAQNLSFEIELDALIWATVAFMASLIFSLVITYWIDGSISKVAIMTAIIVFATGALTIILRDETFVKMKPTIVYGIFAVVLLWGWMRNRSYLKMLMSEIANMDERGWLKLARNWGLFFLFAALLNEFIWRNFSTTVWVDTKTFVYLPLIGGFALSQMPIMMAHTLDKEQESEPVKAGAKT